MEETYLISKILGEENASLSILEMQTYFFRKLNISQFEWLNANDPNVGNYEIRELKNALVNLEIGWNWKLANDEMIILRDRLKKTRVFETIQKIEEEATEALGKNFNLNILFNYNKNDIGDLVQDDVIDLYNFMVNSKILARNEVVKLIYPITYVNLNNCLEENACVSSAYAFREKDGKPYYSAAIGMDFSKEWYEEMYVKNNYDQGYLSTRDYAHTFVHEFGHAFSDYYDLKPEFKDVLNVNIYDVNDPTLRAGQKFYNHFTNNFGEKNIDWFNIGNKFMIQKALDYMVPKIIGNLQIANMYGLNLFAKWILVPSFYGRKELQDTNNDLYHEYTEWFAEGFAYYFLTEPPDCQAIWELWHTFLTSEVNLNQRT